MEAGRQCTITVSPEIYSMAQELGGLVRLDTDTFVSVVIHDLHAQEAAEGRLAARAAGADRTLRSGNVIAKLAEPSRRSRRGY